VAELRGAVSQSRTLTPSRGHLRRFSDWTGGVRCEAFQAKSCNGRMGAQARACSFPTTSLFPCMDPLTNEHFPPRFTLALRQRRSGFPSPHHQCTASHVQSVTPRRHSFFRGTLIDRASTNIDNGLTRTGAASSGRRHAEIPKIDSIATRRVKHTTTLVPFPCFPQSVSVVLLFYAQILWNNPFDKTTTIHFSSGSGPPGASFSSRVSTTLALTRRTSSLRSAVANCDL
jgi:hypothetical protein